jgi:hypothetical protein
MQTAGDLIFRFPEMSSSLFFGMAHGFAMKTSPLKFGLDAAPSHHQWIVVTLPCLVAAVMTYRAIIAVWR